MTEIERQIQELSTQLQQLRSQQLQMNAEMLLVEKKLEILKTTFFGDSKQELELPAAVVTAPPTVSSTQSSSQPIQEKKVQRARKPLAITHEFEDFIGTNVISKVGILVTIIGVFIGAKYAIDNELISPFMRIVAGYLSAGALIFVAFRLKKQYAYFSSILIGGGLAVTYFITYLAYSFYSLYPLPVAFAIMVITTAVAVVIALWYNQRVIALIGQVAAYAIPFLLGNGHGNIFVLFGYVSVINIGLLILSFKKDWKVLYHIAFFLTWLIYLFSIVLANKVTGSFAATLIFLAVNFCTFYATFLSYKIYKKELYDVNEIGLLLLNALLFFLIGADVINDNFTNVHVLTVFTIANALIHFAIGYFIFKLQLLDESVFKFIVGLGLLFITIVIPIEFDGNWVTILWSIEATALAYVGYNTDRRLYLDLALPLLIVALISLLQDWHNNYPYWHYPYPAISNFARTAFANINFILSLLVCACVGLIAYFARKFLSTAPSVIIHSFIQALPVAFIAILYFAFYNEIHFSWDKVIASNANPSNALLQSITLIIFSSVYVAGWLYLNVRIIKSKELHQLLLVAALIVNLVFLLPGLYAVGELRHEHILNKAISTNSFLFSRYLLFASLAVLWVSALSATRFFKMKYIFQNVFSTMFNITLLSVIANEFVHWMDLSGYQNQYKLGLSLIAGAYALILLFTGILKQKRHFRIMAIVLFTVTLLKLFFYDLASLSTISKTIVLVLLGIILLVASFLYNKYKDLLFAKEDDGNSN